MDNQLFTFTSEEKNRFKIPENGLKMTIEQGSKELVIELPGGNKRRFKLTEEEAEFLPALYVTQTDVARCEVGNVDFHGRPISKTPFELDKDYEFVFRKTDGHLGILDIRDVSGKTIPVVTYYWDMVPILLQVEGNDLYLKTAEFDSAFGPKWYLKHKS